MKVVAIGSKVVPKKKTTGESILQWLTTVIREEDGERVYRESARSFKKNGYLYLTKINCNRYAISPDFTHYGYWDYDDDDGDYFCEDGTISNDGILFITEYGETTYIPPNSNGYVLLGNDPEKGRGSRFSLKDFTIYSNKDVVNDNIKNKSKERIENIIIANGLDYDEIMSDMEGLI